MMTEITTSVTLGGSPVQVSPMGVGTMAWGDRFVWGYARERSDSPAEEAFRASLEAGITFFDTAEIYGPGRSEILLGQFIRRAGRPVVVASKFFPYPWRLGKGALRRALRASLGRLGLPALDLYQIHWPLPPVPIETWMDALADAVDAGLVRAVGVSNYSAAQMRRAHEALRRRGIPLASNQVRYSLVTREPEFNGVLAACRELNVTLIAYSPLAMGALSGRYTPQQTPPGVRRFMYNSRRLAQLEPLLNQMREIGQRYGGKTPSQVALNWLMCKGAVPIPGAKNLRQAQENAGALGWRLSAEDVATLDAASAALQ